MSQVHPQQRKQPTNHHHGDGAARPSSGMDLMNSHRPSGAWPCLCSSEATVKGFKSLTAIDAHDRQHFNELRGTVVSR